MLLWLQRAWSNYLRASVTRGVKTSMFINVCENYFFSQHNVEGLLFSWPWPCLSSLYDFLFLDPIIFPVAFWCFYMILLMFVMFLYDFMNFCQIFVHFMVVWILLLFFVVFWYEFVTFHCFSYDFVSFRCVLYHFVSFHCFSYDFVSFCYVLYHFVRFCCFLLCFDCFCYVSSGKRLLYFKHAKNENLLTIPEQILSKIILYTIPENISKHLLCF